MKTDKIKFIPFFILLLLCNAKAQGFNPEEYQLNDDGIISLQSFGNVYMQRPGDNILKITGSGFNHAAAIPFLFSKNILQQKFIDDDLKSIVSSRLKKMNYQEFGYHAALSWYHYWGDSSVFRKCVTGISLGERAVTELRFTRDAFNTVFYGNAMYAGDSAIFTGTGLLNIHFRQLRFSWSKQFGNADSSWSLSLSASLLQGLNANYLATGISSLFTEKNGEFLDLNSRFLYSQSHTTANSLLSFNGTGASADLMLSFPMGKRGNFKFFINDAGFIKWSTKSLHYLQDTSIHFEGIAVNNLFSFKDSSLLNIDKDSVLQLIGVEQNEKEFTTHPPMKIGMCYTVSLWQNKAEFRAGFQYKPAFNLLPVFFVSFSSFKPGFIHPSVMIYGGGAQLFGVGAALSKVVNDKLSFSVGSEDILGLIAPKTVGSASVFVRVGIRW